MPQPRWLQQPYTTAASGANIGQTLKHKELAAMKSGHTLFACLVCGFIWLASLAGCPIGDESRLAHYRQGGAYYGGGPSPSPDGQHIVYSSPRSGNGDLYRVNIDGSGTVRLTSDPRYEGEAEYSSDGKIVFIREDNAEGDVWIMNLDGTGQRQLTKGGGDEGDPTFSPDGSQVVFWRTVPELRCRIGSIRAPELFVIDVDSGAESRLTHNEQEDAFPAISPGGDKVVFAREGRIWTMNRDGTNAKSLGPGWQPRFSPNGEQITFVASRFGREIAVMNVDGSQRRVVFSKNTTVSHPVFLPNGSSVSFLELPGGDGVGSITIVSLDGSVVKRPTSTR